MLTGKNWTREDVMNQKALLLLTSRGIASDMTENHELVVDNAYGVRRLTLSESVLWYTMAFDALEMTECLRRYQSAEQNLGVTLDPLPSVFSRLAADRFLCLAIESERPDALFSLFCEGYLSRALEQSEVVRKEKHCTMYYDRFLHWDKVEHTPRRCEPLTDDESKVLAMLAAENWSPAELARNLEKDYDSSLMRFMIPREKFAILSLDPDADLVRMNYERHPAARQVGEILLHLLQSRKVLLY